MRKHLCLAFVGMAVANTATAQGGGTTLTFGLSSSLRAEDNWTMVAAPAGNSFQFKNDLSFGVLSETRTSSIELKLGAELHSTNIAGSSAQVGLADPYANLSYQTMGPSSALKLDAGISLSDRELDFSDSDGSSTSTNVAASYSFGIDDPFGGSVSASQSETKYQDTTEDDTKTKVLSASAHIDVTPTLTLRPTASFESYEVDDGGPSTTDTTKFGLGVTAKLNDVTTLTANVANEKIDSSTTGETTGISANASVSFQAANGVHKISASHDISSTGERTEVGYDRTVDLGGSEASYGLGIARGSDGSNTFTANFSYRQETQIGSVGASLDRNFITDNTGVETLVTSFTASLMRNITETSSIDVSLNYLAEDETGGSDTVDADIELAYSLSVSEDWRLRTGYQHRYSDESGRIADPFERNFCLTGQNLGIIALDLRKRPFESSDGT